VVVVVNLIETSSPSQTSILNQQNAMLLEEYKERLAPEQVVLLSRLMGGWQLTDSATTSLYDYFEF